MKLYSNLSNVNLTAFCPVGDKITLKIKREISCGIHCEPLTVTARLSTEARHTVAREPIDAVNTISTVLTRVRGTVVYVCKTGWFYPIRPYHSGGRSWDINWSLRNSFKERVYVDFIYGFPPSSNELQDVTVWQDTGIVAPAMAV